MFVELKDAEIDCREFLDCLVHRGIRGASISSPTTMLDLKPLAGRYSRVPNGNGVSTT